MFRVIVTSRARRDAKAGAQDDLAAIEDERKGYGLLNTRRHAARICRGSQVVEQDQEIIAGQAGD